MKYILSFLMLIRPWIVSLWGFFTAWSTSLSLVLVWNDRLLASSFIVNSCLIIQILSRFYLQLSSFNFCLVKSFATDKDVAFIKCVMKIWIQFIHNGYGSHQVCREDRNYSSIGSRLLLVNFRWYYLSESQEMIFKFFQVQCSSTFEMNFTEYCLKTNCILEKLFIWGQLMCLNNPWRVLYVIISPSVCFLFFERINSRLFSFFWIGQSKLYIIILLLRFSFDCKHGQLDFGSWHSLIYTRICLIPVCLRLSSTGWDALTFER